MVRDDDLLGRHGRALGDADELVVEAAVIALEHRQVRRRRVEHLRAVLEAADLRAQVDRIAVSALTSPRNDSPWMWPHSRGDLPAGSSRTLPHSASPSSVAAASI